MLSGGLCKTSSCLLSLRLLWKSGCQSSSSSSRAERQRIAAAVMRSVDSTFAGEGLEGNSSMAGAYNALDAQKQTCRRVGGQAARAHATTDALVLPIQSGISLQAAAMAKRLFQNLQSDPGTRR
eukprot:scaffold125270_cov18-Tisochrysis_lutea.AAC.3